MIKQPSYIYTGQLQELEDGKWTCVVIKRDKSTGTTMRSQELEEDEHFNNRAEAICAFDRVLQDEGATDARLEITELPPRAEKHGKFYIWFREGQDIFQVYRQSWGTAEEPQRRKPPDESFDTEWVVWLADFAIRPNAVRFIQSFESDTAKQCREIMEDFDGNE